MNKEEFVKYAKNLKIEIETKKEYDYDGYHSVVIIKLVLCNEDENEDKIEISSAGFKL